jgi:hypothetical protein
LATEHDLTVVERVPHLANADLRRLDDVMYSVKNGPSLRLVCEADDFKLQARHGLWVWEGRSCGR